MNLCFGGDLDGQRHALEIQSGISFLTKTKTDSLCSVWACEVYFIFISLLLCLMNNELIHKPEFRNGCLQLCFMKITVKD